jgi:hypothetical protein
MASSEQPPSQAPWLKPLQRSISSNSAIEFSKYCQLASVSAEVRKIMRPLIEVDFVFTYRVFFQVQGMPSNRTVVFRGFTDNNGVTIITDGRSEKIEVCLRCCINFSGPHTFSMVCLSHRAFFHFIQHFGHNPHAEIAWYFPLTKEQFRIFGRVV